MNTPSPFIPQGTKPSKGKSSLYFKILMILGVHAVVFGGILLQGCKDTTTKAPDTTSVASTDTNTTASTTTDTVPPVASSTSISNQALGSNVAPPPVVAPPSNFTATPSTTPTLPPVAATAPIAPPTTENKEYVIVHGDTLGAIAKRNGVSLKTLLEANPGVNPKKLKVGQKVQIPGGTASMTASTTTPDAAVAAPSDTSLYTIKSGDMLARIARSHHTTVKAIMALNDLKSTSIRAGQKIKLPSSTSMAEPSATPTASNAAASPALSNTTATTN